MIKGKNYILIIAIDKYADPRFPDLNNPKLDAMRLCKVVIEKYGFTFAQDPIIDENATTKNIVEALNNLSSLITVNDNLIIYFAGHGTLHPKTKKGYWIPSNARDSISDFILNSTVIDYLEGIEAKHLLLISDSCFSGTFLTKMRAAIVHDSFAKLAERKSRWVFSSGREEIVSDGKPGVGSPFAVSMVNFLEKNSKRFVSASELFIHVSKETGDNADQQPVFAHIQGLGHEGGQMIFERLVDEPAPDDLVLYEDADLRKVVISFETAIKIAQLGFRKKSLFAYYSLNNDKFVGKNEGAKDFLCSAYIFDEIVDLIPEIISVDENTFVVHNQKWEQLSKEDCKHLYAEVHYQKTWAVETPYMAICRCNGEAVAFGRDGHGKYKNIIAWGSNQAEAAGKILIALAEEGKIDY